MARFQRGSLSKEQRKDGPTWVLRFYATREADVLRVERTMAICPVRNFKSKSKAWTGVDRQAVLRQVNEQPQYRGRLKFSDLANHYVAHELPKRAHTTQYLHRHIVNDYLLPRWGKRLSRRKQIVEEFDRADHKGSKV